MKAAVRDRFGSDEVVEVREIDDPIAGDDEVLVRVRAASVNAFDWYAMIGRPYVGRISMGLRKPKDIRLGVDFAGVIEAVGQGVTRLGPGDEVFGARLGAFAEYVAASADSVARKPADMSFEEAAALPVAAVTALQGFRDKGLLEPGQRVLINGASGGVGSFAVQIAKALGAEVTAVCSTGNVEIARASGADRVIDYTKEDFARNDERCDVILDVAGSRPWSDVKRVLDPKGTVVIVGGPKSNRLLGPLSHVVKMRIAAMRGSQKTVFFIASINTADLEALGELVESGNVTPVIDRRYELSDTADALRYIGEGHARGKIVISV